MSPDSLPTRQRLIRVIYTTAALQGTAGITLVTLASAQKAALGMSAATYGALYLPFFGASGFASLLAPRLLRHRSLRGIFVVGIGVAVVGLALLAAACGVTRAIAVPSLFVAAGLMGGGLSLSGVALNAVAADLQAEKRGAALSALHASLAGGATLAPLAVAPLAARGWGGAAPLALALAFIAAILWAPRRWPSVVERAGEARGSPSVGWSFRLRGLTALLYGLGEATFSSWAVVYLMGARNIPLQEAGRALACFGLGIAAGRLGLSALLARLRPAPVALALVLGMAASFLAVSRVQTARGGILAFGCAGLACSAVFPLILALAADREDLPTAHVAARIGAFLLVGLWVGTSGLAPLMQAAHMGRVFAASAAGPLLLAVCLLILRGSRGRARSSA